MKRQPRKFVCPVTGEKRDCEKCRNCVSFSHESKTFKKPVCFDAPAERRRGAHQLEFERMVAVGDQNTLSVIYLSSTRPPRTPFEVSCGLSNARLVQEVLKSLTERERKVIDLRFGLTDGYSRTLGEVAEICGCTRERIRQIEAKSLRKLRHPVRLRKLAEALDSTISNYLSEGWDKYEAEKERRRDMEMMLAMRRYFLDRRRERKG